MTFEWHQDSQRTGEPAISLGHKGPVQVYIAKAPSTAASFDGQGSVWTKIYSSGLIVPLTQLWASEVVNATNGISLYPVEISHTVLLITAFKGRHSVVIPPSLPAGQYLLRAEIVSSTVLCEHAFIDGSFRSPSTLQRHTLALNSLLVKRVIYTSNHVTDSLFRQAASKLRSRVEAAPAHRQSLSREDTNQLILASRRVPFVAVLNSLLTIVFRFPLSGQYLQQPSELHRSRRPRLVLVDLTFVLWYTPIVETLSSLHLTIMKLYLHHCGINAAALYDCGSDER